MILGCVALNGSAADLAPAVQAVFSRFGPSAAAAGQSSGWFAFGAEPVPGASRPDPATARPALATPSGKQVIFDGRIDNRAELRRALGLRAEPAGSAGDGRVVAAAFERWGEECVQRLQGTFAIAAWDPAERRLTLMRDHLALAGLYIMRTAEYFAFSSAIGPLLMLDPAQRRELDQLKIAYYVLGMHEMPELTFYKGIKRVESGHRLVLCNGTQQSQAWWRLPDPRQPRLAGPGEYAEALRALFEQIVGEQLESARRPGSMLSGGLDSSSVSAMAAHLLGQRGERLHTFAAVFPNAALNDPRIVESEYQHLVAEQCNTLHHEVEVDCISPFNPLLWTGDEPIPAFNSYIDIEIWRRCEALGLDALMTGYDGDSTIGHGYGRLPRLLAQLRLWTFFRESRLLARNVGAPYGRLVRRFAWRPWRDSIKHGLGHRAPAQQPANLEFLAPDFVREHQLDGSFPASSAALGTSSDEHAAFILKGLLQNMNDTMRALNQRRAVRLLHPFFDRRLIEFCVSLPEELKLRGGVNRWIFRESLGGILPDGVRWRTSKANLGASFIDGAGREIERMRADPRAWAGIDESGIIIASKARELLERSSSRPLTSPELCTYFAMTILTRWLSKSQDGS